MNEEEERGLLFPVEPAWGPVSVDDGLEWASYPFATSLSRPERPDSSKEATCRWKHDEEHLRCFPVSPHRLLIRYKGEIRIYTVEN